ncbi:alpha/beta fold hydrolase [Bacterioplanoides sp.]|uniref:alpha/beta fold hydrolase n=1 Tax=Bacterioplanoides sp. TaxID=2066072 RepID=UPI003B00C670
MKSSSALFPVTLLNAETHGDFNEDVYLLKHNRCSDPSVQIALTHISKAADVPGEKPPLVLVHGSFTNRSFWLSAKGIGLARHLLDEGFDVWLFEHRGHGLSPRNQAYRKNTLEQYVHSDVTAVNDFVREKTGQKPGWIGHSLGGVLIASAAACGVLSSENTHSLVMFGTQAVRRPWYLWLPPVGSLMRLFVRVKGELEGRKLKIGPENESAGIINEHLGRQDWTIGWKFKVRRQPLLRLWQQTDLPLLAVAAIADSSDPEKYCRRFYDLYGGSDKSYLVLGKAQGFSRDYGHVDMVASKPAGDDVWPKISDWLKQRHVAQQIAAHADSIVQ